MEVTNNMNIGDIYLNPIAQDLWILRKDYTEDDDSDEQWILQLVHDDYYEKYIYVKDFVRIGNLYELVEEYLTDKNEVSDE